VKSHQRRQMRILIVDADPNSQKRWQNLFAQRASSGAGEVGFHYELSLVDDANLAMNLCQKIFPDLVLLSSELAEKSGKDICRFIRENEAERHTGVIFVGPNGDCEQLSVECLEIGADDFLRQDASDREIMARIDAVLRLKAMTDELRSANHRLSLLSNTDELTGLHNMRSFNKHYGQAIGDCKTGKASIGVIMMDLDRFKSVNDSSNHLVGSFVIGEVGKLIKGSGVLKSADCAARYGGDEYIIFTRDSSLAGVRAKAQRLGELIKNAVFVRDGRTIRITASIGVSWIAAGYYGKDEDPIKAADMMLYKSKEAGRDCVSEMILEPGTKLEVADRIELQPSRDQNQTEVAEEEEILYRVLNG